MKELLDAMIYSSKQFAKEIVETGNNELPLTLFTLDGMTGSILITLIFEEHKSQLKAILRNVGADYYVLVGEAWQTILQQDSPKLDQLYSGDMRVSDLPLDDRKEMLIIVAAENGRTTIVESSVIVRDKDNKRRVTTWLNDLTGSTGRLVIDKW